jgi:hypothetical protein
MRYKIPDKDQEISGTMSVRQGSGTMYVSCSDHSNDHAGIMEGKFGDNAGILQESCRYHAEIMYVLCIGHAEIIPRIIQRAGRQ